MYRLLTIAIVALLALPAANFAADEPSPFLEAYRAYDAAYKDGRLEEAAELAAEALRLGRGELGAEHEKTGVLAINLGHVLTVLGRFAEAEAPIDEARAVMSALGGPNHPALLTVYQDLVLVNAGQGRLNQAREAFDRAFGVIRKHNGERDPKAVGLLVDRASFEARVGQWDKALGYLDEAGELAGKAFDKDDPRIGDVWFQRGALNVQRGEHAAAEPDLNRAIALWEAGAEPDKGRLMRGHGTLAVVYDKLGRKEGFRRHSDKMLALVDEGADEALPLLVTNPKLPAVREGDPAVTGSALVRFSVGADGRVSNVEVVETDLPDTHRAAIIEGAGRWLFRPRYIDGKRTAQDGLRARVVIDPRDIRIHVGSLGAG